MAVVFSAAPRKDPPEKPTVFIKPQHDQALRLLDRLHLLTREQVQRRFYARSATSYAQRVLRELHEMGLVIRRYQPIIPTRSLVKPPYMYTLSTEGSNWLARVYGGQKRRHRRDEDWGHYLFVEHMLATNDFLIGLELLEQRHEDVTIVELRHGHELSREPIKVQLQRGDPPQEHQRSLAADAWFTFRQGTEREGDCWVEIDRATEGQKDWKDKVAAMIAAFAASSGGQTPYEARFGSPNPILIAVAVVPRNPAEAPLRVQNLVRWTTLELERLRARAFGDLFRFTGLNPALCTPEELFLQPSWVAPGVKEPVPLLEGVR